MALEECPVETEIVNVCEESPLIEPGQQEINDNFIGGWCWPLSSGSGQHCGDMSKSTENPAEFIFKRRDSSTLYTLTQRGPHILHSEEYGNTKTNWVLKNSLTEIQYVYGPSDYTVKMTKQ